MTGDTNKTELVRLVNGSLTTDQGPLLPINLKYHCMVHINATMIVVIGGQDQDKTIQKKSWLLQMDSFEWREKLLRRARSKQACGVLIDLDMPENVFVVAAGGETEDGELTMTVDLWFEDTKYNRSLLDSPWNIGPNLPTPVSMAAGVTTADRSRLFIIGGIKPHDHNLDVFQMQCCSLECLWTTMDLVVPSPSAKGIAFIVPPSLQYGPQRFESDFY